MISKTQRTIYTLLEAGRLLEAINRIEQRAKSGGLYELADEATSIHDRYHYMLQYMVNGGYDPDADRMQRSLIELAYSVADRIEVALRQPVDHEVFFVRRRELGDSTLAEALQALHSAEDEAALERAERGAFNRLWTLLTLSDDDVEALRKIFAEGKLPEHTTGILAGALFVGLMCFYDRNKVSALASAYTSCPHRDTELRSLVYLALALNLHKKRWQELDTEDHLQQQLINLCDDNTNLVDDLPNLQESLVRALTTPQLTRQINERMAGIFHDLFDNARRTGNFMPGMQDIMENSDISEQVFDLHELHNSGGDIYAGTFAKLKSYPFFKTLANWFRPFHIDQTDVATNLDDDMRKIIRAIDSNIAVCSSDKYSITLSLSGVPPQGREQMASNMLGEAEGLREQMRDMDDKQCRRASLNTIVQDLYRFFTMFSRRGEFPPLLTRYWDLRSLITGDDSVNRLMYSEDDGYGTWCADFMLRHGMYAEALPWLKWLASDINEHDDDAPRKIGYALQCMGEHAEALTYYRQALEQYTNPDSEFGGDNPDRNTILRQMAACHRALQDYEAAIKCYDLILKQEPDDAATLLGKGHCLMLSGALDRAMSIYLQVDLMSDEDGTATTGKQRGLMQRAWRAIAWCALLQGNYKRSIAYSQRVIDRGTPRVNDYMNLGHALLLSRDVASAIKQYSHVVALTAKKAPANKSEQAEPEFVKLFNDDRKHLVGRGFNNNDLSLVVDAVLNNKPEDE